MRFIYGFVLLVFLVAPSPGMAVQDDEALQRAIVEYRLENYEEALQLLTQSRAAGVRTPLSDYYTGLCQKQIGNYEAAAENFTSAVNGQPPVKDAALELVSALVNLDRPDEALRWVAWAEREQIKPRDVAFQKGLILSKQKRYGEAVTAFMTAKSNNPDIDQQIDLLVAISYDQDGKKKEARESLKAIITRYPGTDVATFAQEYEQRMSAAGPAKNWNFFLGLNYLYDDNVTLQSRFPTNTAPSGSSHDSGFNQNLRIEYDSLSSSPWSANVQYSLLNTNYTRFHDSNILINTLTASAIHHDETFITSLPFNVTHVALARMGAFRYLGNSVQFSFKPSETIIFTPQNLGQFSIGYSRREMSQASTTPETDSDANIYNGQLGYIFLYAEGQGMVNVRGEIAYEDARGSDQRNLGSRFGVDVLVPLAKNTKLNLSAEGAWHNYQDHANGRKDNIVTASSSINQKILENVYFNIQYSYTRAMSNIDMFDYQHNVISTGVELRF